MKQKVFQEHLKKSVTNPKSLQREVKKTINFYGNWNKISVGISITTRSNENRTQIKINIDITFLKYYHYAHKTYRRNAFE